jgi:hypothetical protein
MQSTLPIVISSSAPSPAPAPRAPFPASVLPDVVAWFDGDETQYTDNGGATTATVGDLVRRSNEASPLSGSWVSTSDAQRPRRLAHGTKFDPFGQNPGTQLQRNATAAITSLNNATLIVSFQTRDGYGGPNMGLVSATAAPNWGIYGGSSGAGAIVNGSNWQAFGINTVARGVKTSIAARYTPTAVKVQMLAAGVTQVATNTLSVSSIAPAGVMAIGGAATGGCGQYGDITQVIAVNRALTDQEMTDVLAWCDALTMPEAFPVNQPLVGIVGDSIARSGVGTSTHEAWWGLLLQAMRGGLAPNGECCNVSIVGAGVGNNAYTNELQAFKSASRARHEQPGERADSRGDADDAVRAVRLDAVRGLEDRFAKRTAASRALQRTGRPVVFRYPVSDHERQPSSQLVQPR